MTQPSLLKKEIQHFNLGVKIQDTFGEIYSKNASESTAEIRAIAHEFAGFSKDLHVLWNNLRQKGLSDK